MPSLPQSQIKSQSRESRGSRVAQLLAGSWKGTPLSEAISPQEMEDLAPLLISNGAGGLAWCRLRKTDAGNSPAAQQLQQAYRYQSLSAAIHLQKLKQVIPYLQNVGVEPVLVKGWAVARLYPEIGMRPFSDIDLCVLPEQYATAQAALLSPESPAANVDLHSGLGKSYSRQTDEIFARSQLVQIDDLHVRVLSHEDHLQFLCLHLLRHGAVRPLWLCDIALMLEARGIDFDWERCLGQDRQQADWVACTIGLAQQLFGVDIEGTSIAQRFKALPRWLAPAVLKAWGTPFQPLGQLSVYLRQPDRRLKKLISELPRHWPNPIEATMTVKGSFNELPRWPFQIGHIFSRSAALFAELLKRSEANSYEELIQS